MKPYQLIDLEADVESIITELAGVRARKGHDYSGTEDTLDNLRDYGWKGVEVRLGDKQKRLMHFIQSGGDLRVKDESIEDTMKDRINYALFSLILYRQEKAKNLQPSREKGFVLGRHLTDPRHCNAENPEGFVGFQKSLPPETVKKSKGTIVPFGSEIGEV